MSSISPKISRKIMKFLPEIATLCMVFSSIIVSLESRDEFLKISTITRLNEHLPSYSHHLQNFYSVLGLRSRTRINCSFKKSF